MRTKNTKRRRTRKGQFRTGAAAVEMALVAPFVFFLIFACFEFSRMMMIRQMMTNAAREGCRTATLLTSRDTAKADQIIRDMTRVVSSACEDKEKLRVTFDPPFTESPDSGTTITTDLEIDCEDVSLLPGWFFAGARIRTTASMQRE